jgi:copper oxidase (laccase) domain-containing protein
MARSPAATSGDSTLIEEVPVEGSLPHYQLPGWRERLGVVAGITGRGSETGRGFDLGLWSEAPIGQVMRRWQAFRQAMPEFDAVVLGNQVHGVAVATADAGTGWIQVDGIDGWVTVTAGVLLTVTVADCVPVYLVVPGRGVALLHAGWRGTSAGILDRGVTRLGEGTGCSVADIVMHCGVGICGYCYEVGSEVMAGCGRPHEGVGPWHLDLRGHLAEAASRLGIETVTRSTWCTAHHRDQFYSHRASGGSDGRMVAYLGMPPGG